MIFFFFFFLFIFQSKIENTQYSSLVCVAYCFSTFLLLLVYTVNDIHGYFW